MAIPKKAFAALLAGVSGSAAMMLAVPANAQQQIEIPLSGTLPVRCNARIFDILVQPGKQVKLILTIEHKCNKGHALHLRVTQGSGASLDRIKISYAGRGPSFQNSSEATFRYAAPVAAKDQLVIELPRGVSAAGSKLLANLDLSILSD